MPSPFYRQSSGGGGGGGAVSEAGGKGALALFGEVKTAATDIQTTLFPSHAEEQAAAKAAADAYATARTGPAGHEAALQGNGQLDIPDLQFGDGAAGATTDMGSMDIGKAVSDMVSGMGDFLNQAINSPMGLLGSILNFLFKLFTEIATSTVEMLNEIAKAAAAAVEDAVKKQLEAAQSAAQNTAAGLQPLELFNQAASTQTLSTALKSTSGT